MCTSIAVNKKKTIIGWNLDILDMEHRVRHCGQGVYIEINDAAEAMLQDAAEDFGVSDCFAVLRAASQEVCPTVVSMVFDVGERTVHWCENRNWDKIQTVSLQKKQTLT